MKNHTRQSLVWFEREATEGEGLATEMSKTLKATTADPFNVAEQDNPPLPTIKKEEAFMLSLFSSKNYFYVFCTCEMKIYSINPFNTQYKCTFASKKEEPSCRFDNRRELSTDVFVCSEKKNLTPLEEFRLLCDRFCTKWQPISEEIQLALWRFNTNTTSENAEMLAEKEACEEALFQDEDTYNKFKILQKKITAPNELDYLNTIISWFERYSTNADDTNSSDIKYTVLQKNESKILQKFNDYQPMIGGEVVTEEDIDKILETVDNQWLRKNAYESRIKRGDLIAEDLKQLIKDRNAYAREKGYPDYYEYILETLYQVNPKELQEQANAVFVRAIKTIKNGASGWEHELKKVFKVKKLDAYHYGFVSAGGAVDDEEDGLNDVNKIIDISKKAYRGMGFDIDKLIEEGKLKLDLVPRPGKNNQAACYIVKTGADSRVIMDLTGDLDGLKALNHELGHAVCNLGVSSDVPFVAQAVWADLDEAVATMMEELTERENILEGILEPKELKSLKKGFKYETIYNMMVDIFRMEFEREMYKNPDQDLKELYKKLQYKYLFIGKDAKPDNKWATISHYITNPGYMQNYFRADLRKEQLYAALKKKLGNITENPNTAEFLRKNLFQYGSAIPQDEIMEKVAGRKQSINDLISSFC